MNQTMTTPNTWKEQSKWLFNLASPKATSTASTKGNLYLLNSEFMKLKKVGKIEIIKEHTRRKPIYDASAKLSHPHLYPNGEMLPLDFHDWKLAEELLRRQTMFAHKTADGIFRWRYVEDDIHMMHQFARLQETRVHARVGFYLSQHPQVAHLPMDSVLNAFKNGFNDQGLLDSHLPDLSALLTKIPNSREKWFAERLDLESISRDLGEPNLFLTVNMDARSWPDDRILINELEYGPTVPFDRNWPYANSEEYTRLMAKFAPQVSIYLCNEVKIFLLAYLSDICEVENGIEKDRRLHQNRPVYEILVLEKSGIHRNQVCNIGIVLSSFQMSSTPPSLAESFTMDES